MMEIMTFLMILSIKMMKGTNPMYLSILILLISLISSFLVFKVSLNSWISFVIILTFSSGMMTLFMYTSSLSSNEMMYNKKSIFLIIMSMLLLSMPLDTMKIMKESMKIFSSQVTLILMSMFLILSMLSISFHGHHPSQTLSTSF